MREEEEKQGGEVVEAVLGEEDVHRRAERQKAYKADMRQLAADICPSLLRSRRAERLKA